MKHLAIEGPAAASKHRASPWSGGTTPHGAPSVVGREVEPSTPSAHGTQMKRKGRTTCSLMDCNSSNMVVKAHKAERDLDTGNTACLLSRVSGVNGRVLRQLVWRCIPSTTIHTTISAGLRSWQWRKVPEDEAGGQAIGLLSRADVDVLPQLSQDGLDKGGHGQGYG